MVPRHLPAGREHKLGVVRAGLADGGRLAGAHHCWPGANAGWVSLGCHAPLAFPFYGVRYQDFAPATPASPTACAIPLRGHVEIHGRQRRGRQSRPSAGPNPALTLGTMLGTSRKPGRKERPLPRRGSSSIIVVASGGYQRGNMPSHQTTRAIRLIIGVPMLRKISSAIRQRDASISARFGASHCRD